MITIEFSSKKVNPVYRPYIQSDNPYEIYWGGAGSGKSYFIAQKLVLACLNSERPFRLVYSRKQATDIRDSQFLLFKDMITEYGLKGLFNIKESNMDIVCANGNMMLSAGMDDPEKIKSIQKPTHIWTEEITEFDYEDFEQLDLRLRGTGKMQYLMSFNPINEEHWVKKELFDKPLRGAMRLRTTFRDNTHIDQKAYEEKLMRLSPHNRRIYMDAEWGQVRTGMEYYPDFDGALHIGEPEYNPSLPLHISLDMNVNPYMTLLAFQIDLKTGQRIKVNQLGEYCLPHPLNKTKYVCEALLNGVGEQPAFKDHKAGIFYYGDATSLKNNTMTSEEINHDYDIVDKVLRTYLNNNSRRVSRYNPAVLKRKDFIGDILLKNTPIDFLIHKRCKNSISDFMHMKEGADGKKFKEMAVNSITGAKYQKYGHTTDATEYMICEAFVDLFAQYERR